MFKTPLLCGCLLALALGRNLADTLTPPVPTVYSSADNTHLFFVQPGEFNESTQTRPCTGTLFKIDRKKVVDFVSPRYVPAWTATLENALSPKGVLVADDGKFVVTINDYSANTDEKTAVVIYDSEGKKIAALGLADLFASEALAKIPESTTSVLWFIDGSIDAKNKILELTVWKDGTLEKPIFQKMEIDLETGKPHRADSKQR